MAAAACLEVSYEGTYAEGPTTYQTWVRTLP